MKSKTGLIFSHIHTRPNELYKFDMLKYAIEHFDNFYEDFFVVLSGHGVSPPKSILEKIDGLYWEKDIDNQQIGRGHPRMCIKSYEILLKNNINKSIKLRYCDVVGNEKLLYNLLNFHKLVITEQTCMQKNMIGDLLMIGNTKLMLDLWSSKPWDYNKSGLYNLFDNAAILDNNTKDFLNKNAYYISPSAIEWYTLENNWDFENKTKAGPFSFNDLWGKANGYPYYGGF